MSNTLFSRTGPDQARLLKTTLDGHMYQDIQRKGRVIKMPRPFIFSLSDPREESGEHLIRQTSGLKKNQAMTGYSPSHLAIEAHNGK